MHQQFPNFNVPPPNFAPIDAPEEDFDAKIDFFLKNHHLGPRKSHKKEEFEPKLKLSDIHRRLEDVSKLKSELKSSLEAIKSQVHDLSEEQFQAKVLITEQLQQKIDENLKFLSENRQKIQELIQKRRNKRKSQRRNRKILKDRAKEALLTREQKHKEIDHNLKQLHEALRIEKQSLFEKEETKRTLSQVHKKIRNAREKLDLLKSLVKLRQIRKQQSQRPELDVNEADFLEEMEKMKHLWRLALEQHEAEEQKLQEYLNEKFKPQKSVEQQWNETIFGVPEVKISNKKATDHPLLKAERSLEDFLGIRREWDACLSDEGSKIPFFWVLPNGNNTEWDDYRYENS
ncbi:mRNA export factor GLE1-like [Culicoides brevitarsis]|uniref:mRNA export factor GLE1-like n=1 Tax=Culicoides brevitarsis TaxID=469753 RepID=UPI00307C90A9